jgi:uncharacterized protein YqhQ
MTQQADEKIMPVGGQAVIEGVMMRSPKRIATAVRRRSGEIEVKVDEFVSLIQRKRYLNVPIVRGAITLIEVMILGIKTLQWSADKAMEDVEEDKKKPEKKAGMSTLNAVLTVGIALVAGVGLFFVLPLYLTTEIFNIEKQALTFNLVAGSIRILFFLLYVWGISYLKDVKRLFEYHGAEHKTIFAFEDKVILSPENAQKYTTFHPRCGTSFLVMVMLISLVFFALLDTLIMYFYGDINLVIRLITHIPLIPFIGGLGFEAIKASARHTDKKVVQLMILPGLALQHITTRKPDNDQLEVAIQALIAALGDDFKDELVTASAVESATVAG